MSREKGLASFSANFESQMASPIDARMIVDTKADLLLTDTWTANDGGVYTYLGMIVAVHSDSIDANNGVYRLIAANYALESSWEAVGGTDPEKYLQYTDTFTTTDWAGSVPPYYLTYLAATHLQGETQNLTTTIKKDNGDNTFDDVIVDIRTSNVGNINIYSNIKFGGVINIGKIGGLGNINFVDAKKDGVGCSGDAGDGNVIVAGVKFFIDIPYNCTVSSWSVTSGSGESGNIAFDVRKANGSIPTVSDSILDSNYLNLSGQSYNQSSNLSGWTTVTFTAGDVLCFSVVDDSTIQKVVLNLWVTKE